MNHKQLMIEEGMFGAERHIRTQRALSFETSTKSIDTKNLLLGSGTNNEFPILVGTSGHLEQPDAVNIDGKGDGAKYGFDGKPVTELGKQLLPQMLEDIHDDISLMRNGEPRTEEQELVETYLSASEEATAPKIFDADWQVAEQRIYDLFLKKIDPNRTSTYYNRQTKGITNAMIGTAGYNTMIADIEREFRAQMIDNKGDYHKVKMDKQKFSAPNFTGINGSYPLTALVGGTQQIDVYLTGITIAAPLYWAKLSINVFDNFGVSEYDYTKYAFDPNKGFWGNEVNHMKLNGVGAFWLLQHKYGYKPFYNVFTFYKTVAGNYDLSRKSPFSSIR
jgi:hypothetical protein